MGKIEKVEKCTVFRASYRDSMKLLDEALKRKHAIDDLVYRGCFDTEKQTIKAVNECLIKAAESSGASLYDLCFHTIPIFGQPDLEMEHFGDAIGASVKGVVRLAPVVFDLERDEEYWKGRYERLVARVREALDNTNEEHDLDNSARI